LASVYDRLTNGFATADLGAAKALIDELSQTATRLVWTSYWNGQ
jgi:hypothetical protein